MALDIVRNPILYSVGTNLAYKIAARYYKNIHYVWCTTDFNASKQPPTSNPSKICKRYLEQITTGDRHAREIENNIAGILKGAKTKFDIGIIDKKEYNTIKSAVMTAEYESFFPVLYIIESEKVKNKCIEVPMADKASDHSIEYRVEHLAGNEFEVIFFRDILAGIIDIADKKVRE